MRHVLEKLNYANRSMKHKLVIYMAAMGLLLAAVLLVSLQIFGRINTPGEELSKSMSIQMEVFRSDMASLWRNVSGMSAHLSKDMTDILEDTLAEQGMTFSELDGNLDAISQVEEALLEPLCQYARQTDCSGAFVILEAAIGVSSGEADRSGLYIQRSNAEHLTGDLLLYRGMAEIGKAHGVMPHRKWSREFNTETLPDYRQCLADAAAAWSRCLLPRKKPRSRIRVPRRLPALRCGRCRRATRGSRRRCAPSVAIPTACHSAGW